MDSFFKNIAETSRNLSTASDLLTKQITEFESALGRHRLGVTAWVTLKVEDDREQGLEYREALGYGKHKGKWGLLYGHGYPDVDDNPPIDSLSEASREVKLMAVAKMPALIRELEKQARELQQKINASAEALQSLSEKIGQ